MKNVVHWDGCSIAILIVVACIVISFIVAPYLHVIAFFGAVILVYGAGYLWYDWWQNNRSSYIKENTLAPSSDRERREKEAALQKELDENEATLRRQSFENAIEKYGTDIERERMHQGFMDVEREAPLIVGRRAFQPLIDAGIEISFSLPVTPIYSRKYYEGMSIHEINSLISVYNAETSNSDFEMIKLIKSVISDANVELTKLGAHDKDRFLRVTLTQDSICLTCFVLCT